MIGVVQVGWQGMADRYTYIPLIGIFIIVAWGVPELMAKWHHRDKVLTIATGVLIPTLMVLTWVQVSHWRNSITIFKHAIRVTDKKYPTFAVAHIHLGNALLAERKTEEAISHYKMAIRIKLGHAFPYYDLGNALSTKGEFEEAISHYKMAIKLKPDYAEAHYNLGNDLLATRETEEAITHYRLAIKVNPNHVLAHKNLKIALLQLKENEQK